MGHSQSSSNSFVPAEFYLTPSRYIRNGVVLMHLAACWCVLTLAVPLELRAAICAAIVLACHGVQSRLTVNAARLQRRIDGAWRFEGKTYRLIGWFAHPALCVLELRRNRRRRYVVIAADALAADSHRRLRALLRSTYQRPDFRSERWTAWLSKRLRLAKSAAE